MQTVDPRPSPDEAVEEAALAHAVRHWEAGIDAANRLSGRSNAVLALIIGVLGYGIWQVDALIAVQPSALRWTMRALLGLSLVLVLPALVVLLIPPRDESRSLPSTRLGMWMRVGREGESSVQRSDVLRAARRNTESANRLLDQENEWSLSRIKEAQALFLSAGLCAGIAVLCYLCFSV